MMKCDIRTSLFTLAILMLFFSIEQVSSQGSIDEIITSAANSSEEFAFLYQGDDDFVIKTELDMLFTKEQYEEMMRLNETSTRKKRKAIRARNYRWTNKIVPYQIYGYFSARDRQQITLAINEWNQYTCVSLRPATARDRNRITIQNGGGCSSYVGMRGGSQPVSLAPNCRIKRIIVHELGHAIGFQHEQTRPDRDSYVYVLRQNIPGSMYFNFQKYSSGYVNNYQVPYDYTSVMHYGAYAFSYNGQRTIQTKNAKYQNIIGKAPGLSFRDIKLANLMYSCGSHCGGKSCPSQGYLDKNCQCMCPGPSAHQPIRKCSGGGGGGSKDCVDQNNNCKSWAAQGECTKNPDYMLVNCKKSCNKCGGGGGGGGSGDCTDKNSQCAGWARSGECDKNPTYMHVNCKKSCNKCGVSVNCVDKNKHCSFWASSGECTKNPNYMVPNCKKSCKKCASSSDVEVAPLPEELQCIDENVQCPAWAKHGECQKNPNYMLQYCRNSCKYCKGKSYAIGSSGVKCSDYNPLCPLWSTIGECQKNPAYMLASCRKSCGKCSPHLAKKDAPCFDLHNHCSQWKTQGYCTNFVYKTYMTSNCPLSCGMCS